MHQASVNKALGIPLTVGVIGMLVKNNELDCKVVAEEFEEPALDPSTEGWDAK
jgi:hypothetical protein